MLHPTIDSFMRGAERAIALFDEWAAPLNPLATADHLCFKCADEDEFERVRSYFETPGAYHHQSWISRRRIAVIRMARPLPSFLGPIAVLELSDQKPDGSQTSGFDHVEIFPTAGSVEGLAASFAKRGVAFAKADRPHHVTYDALISPGFKVRIEPEPLIEKIKRDEMR